MISKIPQWLVIWLTFMPFYVIGQSETEIQDDATIPWAATIEMNYSFRSERIYEQYTIIYGENDFKLNKQSNPNPDTPLWDEKNLVEVLAEEVANGNTVGYSQADFMKRISPESVQAILGDEDYSFMTVKCHELWYYDTETLAFYAIPQAVGLNAHKIVGDDVEVKTVCWIPVHQADQPLDYVQNSDIIWSGRTYREKRFEDDWDDLVFPYFDFDVFKKEQSYTEVMQQMFDGFGAQSSTVLLEHKTSTEANPEYFSADEVEHVLETTDTIWVFDEFIFEEVSEVVKTEFNVSSINHTRSIHDWYWDNKAKKLSVYYWGFMPLVDRFDENGNYINQMPLFRRRMSTLNR